MAITTSIERRCAASRRCRPVATVLAVMVLSSVVGVRAGAAVLRVPADHKTIAAAVGASAAGDTVLVDPGVYKERVKLKAGVTLRSAGDDARGELGLKRAEATVIDGGGKAGDAPGVIMAQNTVLDGFTVTNVGLYDEALWKKHHATQGNEQMHEHIGNFGKPAVAVIAVNCTILNNIVHHNGDTGIGIAGAEGKACSPLVAANVCYRNMGGGIGSMKGSTATIDGNICFQNFYAGIGHNNASPIVVRNVCYENIRAGIGVSEGACPIVRGNRCYANRRAGIGIRTGGDTRPIIDANECFQNDMAGIGTEDGAAPVIRNNRCHHNRMAGIGARKGARPLIEGNDCRENDMAGIGVRDQAVAVIVNNQCIQNKLVALGVIRGAAATVTGNTFVRTGGVPPLVAVKDGGSAVLVDNKLSGGGVAALLVQGSARVMNNHFQGKGAGQGSAVWVWDQSTMIASGNDFDGFRNAVNASGSRITATDNVVRNFQGAAIIVRKPSAPADVRGNVAYSNDPKAAAASVDEPHGIVAGNNVAPAAADPAAAPPPAAADRLDRLPGCGCASRARR